MRTFDLSPLLRNTVGFDQLNRLFESSLSGNEVAFPPYNIEKVDEDDYRITIALAGFTEEDLDINVQEGVLIVAGKGADEETDSERFLHRGIAKRAFERRFRLADTIKVLGASFENGLLVIDLQREIPEHLKPRQISINGKSKPKVIDTDAA